MEGLNQFFLSRGAELWVGLGLLVLILEAWVVLIHLRVVRLMRRLKSSSAPSIEPVGTGAAIAAIQDAMLNHLQKVGMVRFNPFADAGGDQSFSLAMTDALGNGIVLTSLHRRNENRVYAKPLKQWASTYMLTDEEKQAIGIARDGNSDKAESD